MHKTLIKILLPMLLAFWVLPVSDAAEINFAESLSKAVKITNELSSQIQFESVLKSARETSHIKAVILTHPTGHVRWWVHPDGRIWLGSFEDYSGIAYPDSRGDPRAYRNSISLPETSLVYPRPEIVYEPEIREKFSEIEQIKKSAALKRQAALALKQEAELHAQKAQVKEAYPLMQESLKELEAGNVLTAKAQALTERYTLFLKGRLQTYIGPENAKKFTTDPRFQQVFKKKRMQAFLAGTPERVVINDRGSVAAFWTDAGGHIWLNTYIWPGGESILDQEGNYERAKEKQIVMDKLNYAQGVVELTSETACPSTLALLKQVF